tara:strand:+ start:838 stop:1455 length:618 start_codon:yes stop_codon:yes gene_type:complete
MSSKKIAKLLLQIKAIKLNTENQFTWSSGKKSPIYCDNRLTLSYPDVRNFITDELTISIKEKFTNVNLIAGVATAGIPHGALIAHKLNLPFVYVRSSEKKHGRKNKIEGKVIKKSKVVVVEDLISTGKSCLNVANSLQIAGCEVCGIISIFNYNFEYTEEMNKKNKFKFISLCNFNDLIAQAKKENYITGDEYNFILDWHKKFNF